MNKRKTSNKSGVRRGRLFVVSAPSGAGKTTLAEALLSRDKSLIRSVSMTTRKPRAGEKHGRDYFFADKAKFKALAAREGFLEHAVVFGNHYGTPKDFVRRHTAAGRNVLLLIDVQGAGQVRRKDCNAVLIFVRPPSLDVLEKRLRARQTDGEKEIRHRLAVARRELAQAGKYDYVVTNDRLEHAVKELEAILIAEGLRP